MKVLHQKPSFAKGNPYLLLVQVCENSFWKLIFRVILWLHNLNLPFLFLVENDVVSTANPPSSQAVCTIPTVVGRSVIPRLTSSCNQPLPNGTKQNRSPNSSISKRPHSPTLEESPKRVKDIQLVNTLRFINVSIFGTSIHCFINNY